MKNRVMIFLMMVLLLTVLFVPETGYAGEGGLLPSLTENQCDLALLYSS